MRKLLLALLAVALIAAPAFASVQNIKISGSIQTDALYRTNFDFGGSTAPDQKQNLLRSYVTIQLDADLTDNVSATVQLMNERVWDDPNTSTSQTEVDLNLAYVTLREMLYSPMTVVIGRQNFPIGNQLLFDGGTSGETASSLYGTTGNSNMDATDAVRFIFDYTPLTLQAFYAVVDAGTTTPTSDKDKSKLYGLVATYQLGDERNSMVEGVFLSKKTQDGAVTGADTVQKTDSVNAVSLRVSTNLTERNNTSVEIAHQSGVLANIANPTNNRTRDAYAFQAMNTTQLPFLEDYMPILQVAYTKLTGDSSISNLSGNEDKTWTGWDPLYEGQTKNHNSIAGEIFAFSNARIYNVSLQASPLEDVISKLTFTKFYLDQEWQGTVAGYELKGTADFSPSSYLSTVPTNKGERYLGFQLMLENTYNYTEDVQFGLSVALFKPGKVFVSRDSAKQILGSVKVKF